MSTDTADRSDSVIAQVTENALSIQAHDATYCVIDQIRKKSGTAVAVRIGQRCFLATATHVIPESHRLKVILPEPHGAIEEFAARHVHPSVDVGLLELLPRDIVRLREKVVTADRIVAGNDSDAAYDVMVLGFPTQLMCDAERVPLSRNQVAQVLECNVFTYRSITLPRSEWPTTELATAAGVDIFVDFYPDEATMAFLDERSPCATPASVNVEVPLPHGISGGGIWILDSSPSTGIWQPSARLHAIQFSYSPEGQWLRGVTMGTWLDLVSDNYPELASEIVEIRQRQSSD